MTTTTTQLSKTKTRQVISRLARHDSHYLKHLYIGVSRDGTHWVSNSYWAVPLADWPWREIVTEGPGTYVLAANSVSKVNEIYPAFDQLFPPEWPNNGQVAAIPVAIDGVPAFTTESRPLLRLGEIIAVDLKLTADMLGIEESLVVDDIDSQTVSSRAPKVRFTGDPDQPRAPLTVWRQKGGVWNAVGLLMPVRPA